VLPAGTGNAWTLSGIAINQVSKYKYLGVVPGRRIWQARARRFKDASSLWVLEATVMQICLDKSRLLMVPDLHLFTVMYGGTDDEGGQRQDVSGVKLSSISPASPDTTTSGRDTGASTRCTH
jgi:hypothetical protein